MQSPPSTEVATVNGFMTVTGTLLAGIAGISEWLKIPCESF